MIEAEVTCQCVQIALPDLRLSMVNGQVVYLDEADAKASVDLQRAWRAKAVIVKYIQRFRERRAARLALPAAPAASMVGFLPEMGQPEQTVVVDVDAIAARVAELLEPRLVASITASVVAALRSEGPVVTVGAPVASAPPQTAWADAPVFIPSRIGNELEANLELQATTATEGVVSDAAAALRAARKKQEPT